MYTRYIIKRITICFLMNWIFNLCCCLINDFVIAIGRLVTNGVELIVFVSFINFALKVFHLFSITSLSTSLEYASLAFWTRCLNVVTSSWTMSCFPLYLYFTICDIPFFSTLSSRFRFDIHTRTKDETDSSWAYYATLGVCGVWGLVG